MSTTSKTIQTYHGIDRTIIDAAIRKARRERSEAIWALLQKVFGRRTEQEDDGQKHDEPQINIGSIACAGIH